MGSYIVKKIVSRLRGKRDKSSYGYAATRTRAMASQLLTEDDYAKFLKMDINEIIRFLEEKEYKKEIDELGAKASKIAFLELILNKNFARSINRILSFVEKNSPILVYVMRYDIANIKTIIRGKDSNMSKVKILRNLIPTGTFDKGFLQKLSEKESREKVISALKGTPYYDVLRKNKGKKLEELEDALDKFYYKTVLKIAEGNNEFLNLIKAEIDAKNILTIFRLKRAKIKNIEKFLLEGGSLSIKKLREICSLDEFEIINLLKKNAFWKYAPVNTKELDKIEAGFRKYQMLQGTYLLRNYKPSFNTLLGYIIAKEREMNNIRIIARSKLSRNPEDAINIKAKIYLK